MSKTITVTRYLIVIVIILTLAGLAAWYFFLKSHTETTVSADAARGLDSVAPTFTGTVGNTYQNIADSVGPAPGNVSAVTAAGTPPTLWHVTLNPIAGMGFISGTMVPQLYFVERASGNVFSINLQNSSINRLTNTLLPKIYAAAFARDGAVIERSTVAQGKTTAFAGVIAPQNTSPNSGATTPSLNSLSGIYLDQNIVSMAINPSAREVFYVMSGPVTGVIGIRSSWDGTKQRRVFESGITGWRTYWLADGRIILSQNPAYNVAGYAYALRDDGTLTPLIRDIPGLTILPRTSTTTFVYGTATNNELSLYARNNTGDSILLPVKTLADKCVWAAGKQPFVYCAVPQSGWVGDFIGPWLQGRVHSSDTWWKINTSDGTASILFKSDNPSIVPLDVVHPIIDDSGRYVAFMNGNDISLWVLRIPTDQIASSTISH